MPPKKKKGKKSGTKKSAKKPSKASDHLGEEALSDLSKEFYLIQIRDLEARVNRYQKKCDELEIKNKEYKDGYDQQASDKKEIVTFLKKQLEHRADEIADLQERLIGLQQAKDTEKDQYEVQLATLRTEMQEVKDQLTSENMVLGGKLASLEEFRVQKEDLLAKFARLEQELIDKEKDHKEQIYTLEKKSVVDKDRLKKEMILRVNTVAAEFRKVSNKQMAETTKRTLRENVAINAQLSKMSDKTMELIQENDELREKEKKHGQQTDLLEHNESEIMKRNASNQKIIRMLTIKAKEQQELLTQYQTREKELLHRLEEMTQIQNEFTEFKSIMETGKKELCRVKESLKRTEKQKVDLLNEREKLVTTISHCGHVIKEALELTDDSPSKANIDPALAEIKRSNMLQRIMTMMDLAVGIGAGIDFKEFSKRNKGQGEKVIKNLTDSLKKQVGPMSHYQPGDLGLVPPINAKLPSNTDFPQPKRESKKLLASSSQVSKQLLHAEQLIASGTPQVSRYAILHDRRSSSSQTKLPAL